MSSFLNQLEFTPLDDGRRFKVTEEFCYHVGELGSRDIIKVPAGFVTDLASIPRILWAIYPPFGKYTKAAVVHDLLYREGKRSRKEADTIFYEAMKVSGCDEFTCRAFYYGVRAFGWMHWGRG
jgi:hypothetical protein